MSKFYGYHIDDIEEITKELISILEELGPHPKLAILALCKAIADIGTSDDLDIACQMIDKMAELPEEWNGTDYEYEDPDEMGN